ncbi:hypothetical protein NSE_0152 [Neorickettsia sennetsu str. Miyayama]|uniref:Uncharacterized protein n=1 Tax=Ehrlichia sennetsu (strain ATCC VR-367 / Miyayama) TaxID=222891 RepID=Q2GEP6_EHRS3|nr:hypothetical protein NSE_0152 [Neorickettsia sennetsu str. Miyayama]
MLLVEEFSDARKLKRAELGFFFFVFWLLILQRWQGAIFCVGYLFYSPGLFFAVFCNTDAHLCGFLGFLQNGVVTYS